MLIKMHVHGIYMRFVPGNRDKFYIYETKQTISTKLADILDLSVQISRKYISRDVRKQTFGQNDVNVRNGGKAGE